MLLFKFPALFKFHKQIVPAVEAEQTLGSKIQDSDLLVHGANMNCKTFGLL